LAEHLACVVMRNA